MPYSFEISSSPRYNLSYDDNHIQTVKESIVIGGENAIKYSIKLDDDLYNNSDYQEGPTEWVVIKISSNNRSLEIYSTLPNETLTQILSTFKFTN
jgi:hypothetical protein